MPKSHRSGLTVDEIRDVVFSSPPIGKRGYNCDDVDELLSRIEERLQSRNNLSADEVRSARFHKPPMFRRGYNEDEVDEFLDRAAAAIQAIGPRRG